MDINLGLEAMRDLPLPVLNLSSKHLQKEMHPISMLFIDISIQA
jgi:hypothetical protein